MRKLENLVIYHKAMNLCKLVDSILLVIPEDDEFLQATKGIMMEDAMMMAAKIAGAEGGDLYSIRMQNAAIIRYHAMNLYTHVGSLRFHEGFKDVEYVTLIRQELDDFKALFIEWVESFDKTNHIWDDWQLFNPAGAIPPNESYEDPFDINDFLGEDE